MRIRTVAGAVVVRERGVQDRTHYLGALETVLYVSLKRALEASLWHACRVCKAQPGEWCPGVPWPHAVRLRKGVRSAIVGEAE